MVLPAGSSLSVYIKEIQHMSGIPENVFYKLASKFSKQFETTVYKKKIGILFPLMISRSLKTILYMTLADLLKVNVISINVFVSSLSTHYKYHLF